MQYGSCRRCITQRYAKYITKNRCSYETHLRFDCLQRISIDLKMVLICSSHFANRKHVVQRFLQTLHGNYMEPPLTPQSPDLCCTINEKFLKSRTGELVSLVDKIPTLKLKIRNDSPKSVENHTIATKMCCRVFSSDKKKTHGKRFFWFFWFVFTSFHLPSKRRWSLIYYLIKSSKFTDFEEIFNGTVVVKDLGAPKRKLLLNGSPSMWNAVKKAVIVLLMAESLRSLGCILKRWTNRIKTLLKSWGTLHSSSGAGFHEQSY